MSLKVNKEVLLQTSRLLFKPMHLRDAAAVFEYRKNAEVNRFQGFIPISLKETKDFILRLPKQFNQPNSWYQFSLFLKSNNALIGDIGVHFHPNQPHSVELGCTIAVDQQQKGYAKEALMGTIKYLKTEYSKSLFTASLDPRNYASIALVESIGMRPISYTKNAFKLREEWVDDAIYQLKL